MRKPRSGLTPNAQKLRKNMTREESKLWTLFLKPLPITVNRQKVIGGYIVDFYIASRRLVIELDGSQHYEADGIAEDRERDAYLQSQGIRVLRYANNDVNYRFQQVCDDIYRNVFGA